MADKNSWEREKPCGKCDAHDGDKCFCQELADYGKVIQAQVDLLKYLIAHSEQGLGFSRGRLIGMLEKVKDLKRC